MPFQGSRGDLAMGRTQFTLRFAAVAALLLAGSARGPAAEENALRKQVLQLNNITGKDAITGKILELVNDKPALKTLIAEAAEMAKGKDQPFNYNGAFILAKAAYATKDFEHSLAFYKICVDQAVKLRSGQKLVDVYDGLITLYNDHKKYDAAVKACQEFLDIRGDKTVEQVKPFVMEQMILALAKQEKFDDALKLTDKLVEADEGGWYFLRLKAEVLREAGRLDESIAAFEDTIERLGKSKLKDEERDRYVERCRYVLSGVYTDLGKIEKATGELERLLKAHPDSSTYNNDLGYIWADNNLKLDESEKLIRKALDLDKAERKKLKDQGLLDGEDDKENAAYLDSLGWVLYKKKSFPEAKKYLLDAVKSDDGKHVEIFDHLAEVHKALGEKAEAVSVWKKALELENVSKRDEARKEEIKKKLAKEDGENP
jgi:tetratricopeptide (TPR) repeat protein